MTTTRRKFGEKLKAALLRVHAGAVTLEGKHRLDEVELHWKGYAEPGYTDPKSGCIALGDWNKISKYDEATRSFITLDDAPSKLCKELEALGVEIEWSDEWAVCDGCKKLVRTEGNSYQWLPSYWLSSGGTFCIECVKSIPEEYLEYLEGNSQRANTLGLDLSEHGYSQVGNGDPFEHGLHGGQDASPEKIGLALRKKGIKKFIFEITEQSQFYTRFVVHVHESEKSKLGAGLNPRECRADEDPAEVMKRSLQAGTLAAAKVPAGEGPVVIKIQGDKVIAKRVSPQDFVEGRALD